MTHLQLDLNKTMQKSASQSSMGYKKPYMGKPSVLQQMYLFIKWKTGIFVLISLILTLCFFKLFLFSYTNQQIFGTAVLNGEERFFGIMIDAGSTGSRVHVYEFKKQFGSAAPVLVDELFEQIKPGLSSYSDDPKSGAASIQKLLDIAKRRIPQHKWKSTPVALKATAGLRLLPEEQSQRLIDEVKNLLQQYPFTLPEKPVMIMEGTDEGIFGWITVNYLLGRLGGSGGQFTEGAIDLGGGSMQITFAPHIKSTIDNAQSADVKDISIFGNQIQVYVHSYLGLGLMSAREAIMNGPKPQERITITTACMPQTYHGSWKNGQTEYVISGATGIDNTRYELCRNSARTAVKQKITNPQVLAEIKHQPFYVFSYFFDRAAEMKLIDEHNGGEITVQSFVDAATKMCTDQAFTSDQPFLCMDLCLISSFLQDGFGFASDNKLTLKKTIEKKETSWTLGATFYLLNETK
uniref:nucleoside diphosphate phosphatase n=1 Tax=Ciona savignyi TaxID=51511 RepID=H2YL49_CIOSA